MSCWRVAAAATPDVSREVMHLLQFVQQSGCAFYRNGSWYPASRASEHLRLKYDYLDQRHQVSSTEDFIAKAATRSSVSGEQYQVRCVGTTQSAADSWLNAELARYRATLKSAAR